MNEFHNVNLKDVKYRKHLQTLETAQQQLQQRNYQNPPANALSMHSTYGYTSNYYPLSPQIYNSNRPDSNSFNYDVTSDEPPCKQSKMDNKKYCKQRMLLPPTHMQDGYHLAAAYSSYMSQSANVYNSYNQHNNLVMLASREMHCNACYTPQCTCMANVMETNHLSHSIHPAVSVATADTVIAATSRTNCSPVSAEQSTALWHCNPPPMLPLPPMPPIARTSFAMDQRPLLALEGNTKHLTSCQKFFNSGEFFSPSMPLTSPPIACSSNALMPAISNNNSIHLSKLFSQFSKVTSKKDLLKSNSKKLRPMRKPIPSRCGTPKDLSLESAIRAIRIEEEYTSRMENVQSLVLRFPDPEINSSIVRNYSSDISGVYFLNSSASRHCTVHLKPNAKVDELITYLSKIPFGTGFLNAELKTKTTNKVPTKPEDIDPCTLYVGNLSKTITREILRQCFPKCIRIDIGFAIRLKKTRYAFIRYSNVDDAIDAFKNAFNIQAENRSIILRFRRLNNNALKESDADSGDGDLDIENGGLLMDENSMEQDSLQAQQNGSDTDTVIENNKNTKSYLKNAASRKSSIGIQTEDDLANVCECKCSHSLGYQKRGVDVQTQTNFDNESDNEVHLLNAATQTSSSTDKMDEISDITIKKEIETTGSGSPAGNNLQEIICGNASAVTVKIETADADEFSDIGPSSSRNIVCPTAVDNDQDDMVPENNLLGKLFVKHEPIEVECDTSGENVTIDSVDAYTSMLHNSGDISHINKHVTNGVSKDSNSKSENVNRHRSTNMLDDASANHLKQSTSTLPLNTSRRKQRKRHAANGMDTKAIERDNYLKRLYQDIYDDDDADGKRYALSDSYDLYRKLNSDSDSDLDNLL